MTAQNRRNPGDRLARVSRYLLTCSGVLVLMFVVIAEATKYDTGVRIKNASAIAFNAPFLFLFFSSTTVIVFIFALRFVLTGYSYSTARFR